MLSGWRPVQEGPGAILNLRPTERRGIAIGLLHLAFTEFQRLCQDVPNSARAAIAMQAAIHLCDCMGNAFDTDDDRSDSIDECVAGFLRQANMKKVSLDDSMAGCVRRAYSIDGAICVIREE